MDFWSRLIGGAPRATPTKQATVNDSKQRLTRFRQVHNQLLQTWNKNHLISPSANVTGKALEYLQYLRQTLQDETQSSAPHPCIAYVASSQVYEVVTKVALLSVDERHIHEGLDFLNILLDSEEGDFLEDDGFADILIEFVNTISFSGTILVSTQIEGEIVEILFGIASKLRIQPAILPTWFRPRIHGPADVLEDPSNISHLNSEKIEFPLFYFLLNFVHHDGRAGDFARTGLLYLIEAAAKDEELEKWIVESDLATLMASGLGALYSRLSSKLVLSYAKNSIPAVVAFSEVPRQRPISDAEETGSPEFQVLLGTFLSHLMFWQDVLEHCTSTEIKQSLLDHFQFLFLQQLLYPSLLESSDVDGGSSVAVLTYLRCILETVGHPDLVHLILQYLFALPEVKAEDIPTSRPTTLARRRKSQNLITNLAKGEEKPSPTLFTLVDLILTSLRSRNQQTVTATLHLCSVIIHSQHPYAISTLIRINAQGPKSPYPTIAKHDLEIDNLFSLAEDLATQDRLDGSYEAHLYDVRNVLEAHCCSSRLLALPGNDISLDQSRIPKTHHLQLKSVGPHFIAHDDPLLECLLSLLKNFLVNDIETNLSLTQVFTTLASCGFTRLEGWILGDGTADDYPWETEVSGDEVEEVILPDRKTSTSDEIEAAKAHDLNKAPQKPLRQPGSESPVFTALDSLVKQVESFRQKVQDFDIYLVERKHIFKVGEEIDSALADTSPPLRKSEDSKSTSPTTLQSLNHISSISQRLLIETSSSNASRATSPRGRQHTDPSASRLIGRLNHLRISTSPSPSKSAPRTYSPSPLRKDSLSSTPPKIATPMGPPDALLQKIKLSTTSTRLKQHTQELEGSETSSMRSGSVGPGTLQAEEFREISLGHLLTNVIILQEFILELAALVEVRASLFGEIGFV